MAASISVQVNLLGLDSALTTLQMLQTKSGTTMEQAINTVALYFRDNLVLFAQAGHPDHPNVITGRLSGSMRVAMHKQGITSWAEVGSDAGYAAYVEFGHMSPNWGDPKKGWHKVPAYPFFQPAIMQTFDSGDAQSIFDQVVANNLGAA